MNVVRTQLDLANAVKNMASPAAHRDQQQFDRIFSDQYQRRDQPTRIDQRLEDQRRSSVARNDEPSKRHAASEDRSARNNREPASHEPIDHRASDDRNADTPSQAVEPVNRQRDTQEQLNQDESNEPVNESARAYDESQTPVTEGSSEQAPVDTALPGEEDEPTESDPVQQALAAAMALTSSLQMQTDQMQQVGDGPARPAGDGQTAEAKALLQAQQQVQGQSLPSGDSTGESAPQQTATAVPGQELGVQAGKQQVDGQLLAQQAEVNATAEKTTEQFKSTQQQQATETQIPTEQITGKLGEQQQQSSADTGDRRQQQSQTDQQPSRSNEVAVKRQADQSQARVQLAQQAEQVREQSDRRPAGSTEVQSSESTGASAGDSGSGKVQHHAMPGQELIDQMQVEHAQTDSQLNAQANVSTASHQADTSSAVGQVTVGNSAGSTAPTAQAGQATANPGPQLEDAAPDKVASQVVRGIRAAVNQRGGTVTLRLQPAELGELKVKLQISNGMVQAQFQAANDQVRDLLNQQMQSLRQALESHGMGVERIQVQVAQADEGHAQQQQQDTPDDGQSRGRFDDSSSGQNSSGRDGDGRDGRGSQPRRSFDRELLDLVA